MLVFCIWFLSLISVLRFYVVVYSCSLHIFITAFYLLFTIYTATSDVSVLIAMCPLHLLVSSIFFMFAFPLGVWYFHTVILSCSSLPDCMYLLVHCVQISWLHFYFAVFLFLLIYGRSLYILSTSPLLGLYVANSWSSL